MLNSEKMLTPGQAAERLNVPIETVREWLRDATLRGVKVNNRWQIEKSDVEQMTRQQECRDRVDKPKRHTSEGEVASILFRVLGGERPTE